MLSKATDASARNGATMKWLSDRVEVCVCRQRAGGGQVARLASELFSLNPTLNSNDGARSVICACFAVTLAHFPRTLLRYHATRRTAWQQYMYLSSLDWNYYTLVRGGASAGGDAKGVEKAGHGDQGCGGVADKAEKKERRRSTYP